MDAKYMKSALVTLEPGDATRYKIMFSRDYDLRSDHVYVALFSGRHANGRPAVIPEHMLDRAYLRDCVRNSDPEAADRRSEVEYIREKLEESFWGAIAVVKAYQRAKEILKWSDPV